MRLQQTIGKLFAEFTGGAQFLFRRRHGESQRDGITQPPTPVPSVDEFGAVRSARGGVIEHIGWSISIHHRLAGNQPEAAALSFGEQRLRGNLV